jgi:transposase InsO family protein
MKYEFIETHKAVYKITEICDCFDIKPSGYYAWKKRELSARSIADAAHATRIKELHEASNEREGHRVIHDHLKDESIACGRDKTLKIMQELGLAGIQKKTFKPQATDSNHTLGYSPNLFKARGMPEACNQVWVCDTTYLMTDNGWHYLATVMDLFSRRIVGWEVSEHNDGDLVRNALYKAAQTRHGFLNKDLIVHSDRGSTYAGDKHRKLIRKLRIKQSMSAKGNCYDNAAMESFYGRYKTSSVGKHVFADLGALRAHAFAYIECYYNTYRKHSSLGYKTPMQIEEKNFPLGGRKLGDATLHSLQTTSNNQNQVALGDLSPTHSTAMAPTKRNVN